MTQLNTRNITLFISLIAFIYVLRNTETTPSNFLSSYLTRILDSAKFSDALCSGIDTNNNITSSEIHRTLKFRSQLNSMRGGNPLVTFTEGPDPSSEIGKDYILPIVKLTAAWLVFFVISFVACIGFLINWCCISKCSGGCKACKAPKSRRCHKGLVIGSAFFMTALCATSLAGVVISSNFPSGGQQTICSLAQFLDKALGGSQADKFVGADPAIDKLFQVLDNIDAVSANVNLVAATSGLTPTYTATSTAINSMYVAHNGDTVARGDQDGSPANYQPTYIANIASTDSQTGGTGAIQAELDAKKNALDNAFSDLTTAIPLLKAADFLVSTEGELEHIREVAVNISKNITKLENNLFKGGSKGQSALKGLAGGIIGLFVVKMLTAILGMISIVLAYRGVKYFKRMMTISWITLSSAVVLTWLLATIMFPLMIVLTEACEVADRIFYDQVFFNITIDKYANNTAKSNNDPTKNSTRDTMFRCFYGDGDLIAGERSYLTVFQEIGDSLDSTAYLTESQQTVVNSVQIDRQTPLINHYQNGIISDAPEATQDLNTLNSYTNHDGCSQMQDNWIFASANCISSEGTVFPSGALPAYNVLSPTCIGFDVWSSSTSDIQTRYTTARFSGCPAVGGTAAETYRQNFVNNFKTSRTQVSNVFSSVASDLSNVKSANDNYMTAVKQYTAANYAPLWTAHNPLYQPLNNQTGGILPNMQCLFFRPSIQSVEERLCYRFSPTIYEMAIVLIVSSFFGMFGAIMMFFLWKNFTVVENGKIEYDNLAKGKIHTDTTGTSPGLHGSGL